MSYRTRDKVLLVGVQIDGTELALTGADAIRVAALRSKPTINTVATNYHRGTTNKSVDEAGGGYNSITFTRLLTGSGVAGTPPREDRLLRGCGLKATAVAGAATLAVTAGSAMSVTLSLASPILAATPRGCVVVISAGTGIGQRRAVTGYDNTSKVVTVAGKWDTVPDATSKIDILQGTLYTPRLDSYERVTAWEYARNKITAAKSRRTRAASAMGTFTGRISTGNPMEMSWTMRGLMPANPDDVAMPDPITYGTEAAVSPKLLAADVFLGGDRFKFSEATFDLAATLDQQDNPTAAMGYDAADITEHATGGRIVPERLDLATRDLVADFRSGTPRDLALAWGAPTNGFSLLSEIKYVAVPEETDVRGRIADAVNYRSHREADWFHLFAF